MLQLLLLFELKKIQAFFRTKTAAKIITSILFVLVFVFVGVGIYYFFINGFRYINASATEDIQEALSLFLYEVFLLLLSGVIVMSALITSVFTMFKGGNNNWVMSSPLHRIFPHVILVRSILNALLPSFTIFIPAILAFSTVYTATIYGIILVILSVLLLIILLTASTLFTIVGIGALYYAVTKKINSLHFTFRGLLGLIFVVLVSLVIYTGLQVQNVDLVKLFRADETSVALSISTISDHFTLLPSHLFATELLSIQMKNISNLVSSFLQLLAVTFGSVVTWYLTSSLFYVLWQKLQEGTTTVISVSLLKNRTNRYRYIFGGTLPTVLFKKEALISIRNLRSVIWFLFLLLIWLAYVTTNHVLGNTVEKNQINIQEKMALLQALHYSISIYFIAAFTLRFVFPAFSAERKTAWILGTAPLKRRTLFLSKYLSYSSFFVIVGLLMNAIDTYLLHVPVTEILYSSSLFVLSIIAIVTLGLTLGALFPSTDTDDPEAISTSISGLSFTLLAGLYGALGAYVLYMTVTKGIMIYFFAFIVLTFIVICGLLLTMSRYLQKNILL